jgi:hypothetical protein
MSAPVATDSPLGRSLARLRAELNGQFAVAARGRRELDPERFLADFSSLVRELSEGCDAAALDQLVRGVFRQLLTLHLKLGPADALARDAVLGAWRFAASAVPALLASAPQELLGALGNAILRLSRVKPEAVRPFVSTLVELGSRCPSLETYLDLGTVAAWRLGHTLLRDAAVARLAALPDAIGPLLFGLDASQAAAWSEVAARLAADPWLDPAAPAGPPRLAVVGAVGGFVGFGGPFLKPPTIVKHGDMLVAFDEERAVRIVADRFGLATAAFAATRDFAPDAAGKSAARLDGRGNVAFQGLSLADPRLLEPVSWAAVGSTLVVSVKHSLRVLVIARLGGG